MYNEEFKKNLINFLKRFQNRPHHLAIFLIQNSALTEVFIERIIKSGELDKPEPIFNDISQMEEYYNSLIDVNITNEEEVTELLNKKLDVYILEEKFEEAAKLRDYMKKNKIKRVNNKL
jgi:hypothetical protein